MQTGRNAKRLTVDEFERMDEEDGYRLSLVRGRVVREPAPGGRHGYVLGRLCAALDHRVQAIGQGVLYANVGVVIRTDPATVRVPDLALYARDQVADPWPDGFFRTPPHLAVEILSPSDRARAMRAKVADYLGAGSRMVWVVNPRRRTVQVHRVGKPDVNLSEQDTLAGDDAFPGLHLPVKELFALPGYDVR